MTKKMNRQSTVVPPIEPTEDYTCRIYKRVSNYDCFFYTIWDGTHIIPMGNEDIVRKGLQDLVDQYQSIEGMTDPYVRINIDMLGIRFWIDLFKVEENA